MNEQERATLAVGESTISAAAKDLLHQMGCGRRLRIPKSGFGAELRPHDGFAVGDEIAVDAPPVRELIERGLIRKLTEDGEPPPAERTREGGYRIGWREAGYDGDVADWWTCTQ
jgi:hypothetical protein